MCHRSYSFTWNRGGKPAGSNTAPAGLYTFDVEVIANPYDRDAVRSQALSVDSILGGLYYDDKGTEDESDDEEFLVVEYVLKSDRNANSGEMMKRLERKEVVIVVVHKHREQRMEIGYLTIFLAVKLVRAEFEILGGIIISIRLVPEWYLLPHCINCSRRQGGNIRSIKRWVKNETKECTLSHSGSGGGGSW